MSQTSFDWDRLRIFYIVAEAGSFTEAGKKLHLSQSAVSRQIAALEDSLGIPLFHRHARGLVMTEAGESLFETARELSVKLLAAEGSIRENQGSPKGKLRIFATVGLGGVWLASRIGHFCELYPDIQVSLKIDDYDVDLTKAEADCGIQVKAPNQPGVIQRIITSYTVGLYASKEYLKKYGTPENPVDLDKHRIIAYGNAGDPYGDVNWPLIYGRENEAPRTPAIRTNSAYAMLNAVIHGAGITSIPDYMTEDYPTLTRLFPDLTPIKLNAYFVYPEALKNSKRIAIFRDFVVAEAKKTKFNYVP